MTTSASMLLVAVLAAGWWGLWMWWLGKPVTDAPHRLVIPLAVCAATSWLLVEAGTRATAAWRRRAAASADQWLMGLLGACGIALWIRLSLIYPVIGAAAAACWAVNRRWPLLRSLWHTAVESRWSLPIILGVAFALRLACIWRLEHAALDPAVLDGPDSGYYHAAASALAAGQVRLWEPSWLLFPRHNPGPVLLYSLLYAVTGPHVIAARLVQLVMALWSCLLVYGIGRRLFDERVGRLAAFLVAGRGYLITYGSYIGTESPGLFFAALCAWWWLCMIQEEPDRVPAWRRALWVIGSGLSASWLILMRPELLPWPALVAAFGLWRHPRIGRMAWVAVIALSLCGPGFWIVRNRVVHGLWSLQSARMLGLSSWTRLERLGVLTHPVLESARPDAAAEQPVALPARMDWARAAERPAQVAWAAAFDVAERVAQLWSWTPYVFTPALIYVVRDRPFIVYVSFVLGLGLLAGLWQSRFARPGLAVLGLLLLTKTAVHGLTVVQQWHRYTMEPFINIVEAAGLIALAGWIRVSSRAGTVSQPAARWPEPIEDAPCPACKTN